ncbi:MAG: sigma-70 family RNA polymerase sigma factor, partial [Chloroflexota bacterium]|nr:sigma-70 family RNA polymerase sigma factor [Chloroflexota bacterium]
MGAAGIAAVRGAVGSDADLVAATRAGDESAFSELYRRYHPMIVGYVRRLVRDHGRAEDVAQEAFVSALRRLRQTETEINFKPWIYEIARNASIDLYRRKSRAE